MTNLVLYLKGVQHLPEPLTMDGFSHFASTRQSGGEEHKSLMRQGNVRIEARFKKPLPDHVACILYAHFPGHAEIDNSRIVTV